MLDCRTPSNRIETYFLLIHDMSSPPFPDRSLTCPPARQINFLPLVPRAAPVSSSLHPKGEERDSPHLPLHTCPRVRRSGGGGVPKIFQEGGSVFPAPGGGIPKHQPGGGMGGDKAQKKISAAEGGRKSQILPPLAAKSGLGGGFCST